MKQHADNTLSILGRDRICWVNVIEEQDRFVAKLRPEPADKSQLCYWLPWKKDGVVRIKLKPSGKSPDAPLQDYHLQSRRSSGDSSILAGSPAGPDYAARDLGRDPDPKLFFTAMMNGCSTWVAGNADQPVVYHINRASYRNDQAGPLVAEHGNAAGQSALHRIKTEQMEADFTRVQTREKARFQGELGRVTPVEHDIHKFDRDLTDYGRAKVNALRSRWARWFNGPIRATNQYTSTFGIKRDGGWVFFAQDIYEYRYLDKFGNFDMKRPTQSCAAPPHIVFPRA